MLNMETVFSDDDPIIVIQADDDDEFLEEGEERYLIFVDGDLAGIAYDEQEAHQFAQELWFIHNEVRDDESVYE